MARRRAAREGLDDDHAAAATCRLVVIRSIGIGRFALRLWPSEQFADARDVVGARGLGQQAVVADAVEALRQDVNEESADELVCGKCHLLVSISALDRAMPFPPHTHPKPEIVTVISGTFTLGMGNVADKSNAKPLPAGSFFAFEPRMAHYAFTDEETVVQSTALGRGVSIT